MPLRRCALVTLPAMVGTSFVAGLVRLQPFDFAVPAYLSGPVGSATAIPAREFLKRVGPKEGRGR